MSKIVNAIRAELINNSDESTREMSRRYFKEEVKCYGLKTATAGKIAKKYWNIIKDKDKKEIFNLCEELFKSDYMEDAFMVSFWGMQFKKFVTVSDLKIYAKWINKYINNWAKCDGFCGYAVGDLLLKYPHKVSELKKWAKSKNRWMKRAAAVSLIVPARKGLFLDEAFEISDLLLTDKEDLVQKGYGWLLKVESKTHQQEVFEYVINNKAVMPRTALRYAIELMPKKLKIEAMKKSG
jgi:3-methyladenine DNA glycosylase AlkD